MHSHEQTKQRQVLITKTHAMKGKGREWDESQQQPRLSVADTTNTPHALALSFFFKHVIVWDKQIR